MKFLKIGLNSREKEVSQSVHLLVHPIESEQFWYLKIDIIDLIIHFPLYFQSCHKILIKAAKYNLFPSLSHLQLLKICLATVIFTVLYWYPTVWGLAFQTPFNLDFATQKSTQVSKPLFKQIAFADWLTAAYKLLRISPKLVELRSLSLFVPTSNQQQYVDISSSPTSPLFPAFCCLCLATFTFASHRYLSLLS